MTGPERRVVCGNCGELVASADEHYVDAERVGCWWRCETVEKTRERIEAYRREAAHATEMADRLSERRAQRLWKGCGPCVFDSDESDHTCGQGAPSG